MLVTLVLTHACNLACGYCYMGEHHARSMPPDVAGAALRLAFASKGPLAIGFFGGEPLLETALLLSVCDEARARAAAGRRSLRLTVTTNGTLLDDRRLEALASREVDIALSLDGTREAQDAGRRTRSGASSFEGALSAAKRIRAAGIPLSVIAVVTPDNVRRLSESVAYLASVGVSRLEINPCYEGVWSDEDLAQWEAGLRAAAGVHAERMRAGDPIAMPLFDNKLRAAAVRAPDGRVSPEHPRQGCSLAGDELAVAPSGRLYPCPRLVGEDRAHRFVIGDVHAGVDRTRLEAIARGPADEACEPCVERWRCSAFCVCANVAETGASHLPGGVQCWHEQIVARIADEIGHELLEKDAPVLLAHVLGGVGRTRRLPVAR